MEVRDSEGTARAALEKVAGVRSVQDPEDRGDGLIRFAVTADTDIGVRERIFDAAVASGFKLLGLSSKTLSLEDVFVEITTGDDCEEVDGSREDEEEAQ